MATFTPSKKNITDFNGGEEYQNGSGLQAETLNNIIESQLYTQGLAKNAPNVTEANQEGTATVTIEQTADGTPRLKFANLKGATGSKIVSQYLSGQDQNGGNIYLQAYDDGSIHSFTAPKGEKGDTPDVSNKADIYIATTTIAVGEDLSGKTLVFDTSINPYDAEYTSTYGETFLRSSGGYYLGSRMMPELAIRQGGAFAYDSSQSISEVWWDYSNNWYVTSVTLPADFGVVEELNASTNLNAFITISGDAEIVDCKYNYDLIRQLQAETDLLKKVYPVGSIYMSTNSTSPASFIGGTWERIQDRFLYGAGTSYLAGEEDGSKTHTHTLNNAFAKIYIGTLAKYDGSTFGIAVDNNPATPLWTANRATRGTSSSGSMVMDYSYSDTAVASGAKLGGSTDSANNLPPFVAVYMWKRTG